MDADSNRPQLNWSNLLYWRVWWRAFWIGVIGAVIAQAIHPGLFYVGEAIGVGFALYRQMQVPANDVAITYCPTCNRRVGVGKRTCRIGHPV